MLGEVTTYRGTALASSKDVVIGAPSATVTLPPVIVSEENCSTCHDELRFHGGGRLGLTACLLCHGTAGSEDRPQYVSANGDKTQGVTIDFRTMLHKIHMGKALSKAKTYTVVGFGGSPHTYGEVVFPAQPGAAKHCTKCHVGESWKEPKARDHPTQQGTPTRVWRATCASCHDADAIQAHVGVNTYLGSESCATCHGSGAEQAVDQVHRIR